MRALDIVHHNQTFASADSDNEKYAAMFPDSQIAKNYHQKSTKINYVITHGIAQFYKQKLLKDLEGKSF